MCKIQYLHNTDLHIKLRVRLKIVMMKINMPIFKCLQLALEFSNLIGTYPSTRWNFGTNLMIYHMPI